MNENEKNEVHDGEDLQGAEKAQKENTESATHWLPIGMCLGISIGMSIGVAMDNVGVGMCLGVGFGSCLGAFMDAMQKKK